MVMKLQIFRTKKSKAGSNYSCLAIISLGSALKKDKNYYRQKILKECKYIKKEKDMIRHNIDELESSSEDSDEE